MLTVFCYKCLLEKVKDTVDLYKFGVFNRQDAAFLPICNQIEKGTPKYEKSSESKNVDGFPKTKS